MSKPTPKPLPKPVITRVDFFKFNESLYTGRDKTCWRVMKYAEGLDRPHAAGGDRDRSQC